MARTVPVRASPASSTVFGIDEATIVAEDLNIDVVNAAGL